ncbi:MAG: CHC2 zinc finger domain-containing protein, partial [Gemmatimonadota bacterium]|nr:CHC2 zinc finger domain-containing protein [Gemmatimonadota bacterium]
MSRPNVTRFDIEPILRHLGADIPHRNGAKVPVRCPFHDDRHPSATVLRDTQRFICFTCDLH